MLWTYSHYCALVGGRDLLVVQYSCLAQFCLQSEDADLFLRSQASGLHLAGVSSSDRGERYLRVRRADSGELVTGYLLSCA